MIIIMSFARHLGNACFFHVTKFKMAETDTVQETITVVPVTGAIYHNGQEKPTERWSFELGLNLSEDKILSTVLKHLEKGYGIKDKCATLNITKFKLQASVQDFTPILPKWPKGRIFSIDSQEQWDNCFPKVLGLQRELVGKRLSHQCSMLA